MRELYRQGGPWRLAWAYQLGPGVAGSWPGTPDMDTGVLPFEIKIISQTTIIRQDPSVTQQEPDRNKALPNHVRTQTNTGLVQP